MLCVKFSWNWPYGSGEEDLAKGLSPSFEETWIPFTKENYEITYNISSFYFMKCDIWVKITLQMNNLSFKSINYLWFVAQETSILRFISKKCIVILS